MSEPNIFEKIPGSSIEDDRFWWMILFGLIQNAAQNDWEDFTDQLLYQNRFSSSNKVISLISEISDYVTDIIPTGTILYRARIFRDNPTEEFMYTFYKSLHMGDGPQEETTDADWEKDISQLIYPIIGTLISQPDRMKQFKQQYEKWQKKRFKGYNSIESDMPPKGKATEGRVNPEKISYLYLSEDPQTCIYEVRPTIGQYVSIARIKVAQKIKIYNLNHSFPDGISIKDKHIDASLFEYIGQQFSKPYTAKPLQYLPTQYIGETIKNLGFDGLRFGSSLHQGGSNVVLFDNTKCKPISSDFVQINDIKLSINNPEMYDLVSIVNKIGESFIEN